MVEGIPGMVAETNGYHLSFYCFRLYNFIFNSFAHSNMEVVLD